VCVCVRMFVWACMRIHASVFVWACVLLCAYVCIGVCVFNDAFITWEDVDLHRRPLTRQDVGYS